MLATVDRHLHVLEAALVEVDTHRLRDPGGILVGDQAHVDLRERLGRRDRLHACIGPARADARDVAGWLEGVRDLSLPTRTASHELTDLIDALDLLFLEGKGTKVLELLFGRWGQIIQKPIDGDGAVRCS